MKKLLLLSLVFTIVLFGCDMLDDALEDDPGNENPPLSPSLLEASITQYNNIRLTWQDNSEIEDGFIIQVKINNGSWEDAGEVSRNRSSFQYDDLVENYTYLFRVKAFNEIGDSDWYTGAELYSPIFIPSSLSGFGQDEMIVLEWVDNSFVEDGYRLERRLATGGEWDDPVVIEADAETYTDETVETDVEYEYRLRAYVGSDYSEYSNSATVSTESISIDLIAPTNLTAQPAETKINLTWSDNSDNEEGFVIERMSSVDSWSVIETTPANTSIFEDNNVITDIEYSYRLQAVAGSSSSDYSNITSAMINSAPSELEAPSNLHADVFETGIDLFWEDNSTNELGFYVERSQGSGSWEVIATLNPNTETLTDEAVETLSGYNYRVQAFGADDLVSDYSNAIQLEIPFYAPTNTTASYIQNNGFVRITWRDNSSVETSYEVAARVNGGQWFLWVQLDANTSQVIDNEIIAGDTYDYKVCARKGEVVSPYSNTTTVHIPNGGNTETVYSSDFESDTVGDFPYGWNYSLAGVNASISNERAASGSKSIKFRDPNAGGNGYLQKEITGSGYTNAEVNFKIYFNNEHGTLAFTANDASVQTSFLQFEENGHLFAINGSTNQTIFENYQVNHWYEVSIRYDMTNHLYDVWVDGSNVANNLSMMNGSTGPLTFVKFNMWGDRILASGAFVDDVEIIYFFNY